MRCEITGVQTLAYLDCKYVRWWYHHHVDNGDGVETINRHFAENQDHLAKSPGSAIVTIYVFVSIKVSRLCLLGLW